METQEPPRKKIRQEVVVVVVVPAHIASSLAVAADLFVKVIMWTIAPLRMMIEVHQLKTMISLLHDKNL